jgi:hypothetical protein
MRTSRCDLHAISYNSCRNRHCRKCQAQARQRWLARRELDLLPVPARQPTAHHDTHSKRVPAPILPTCAAQRIRPHPPLRLPRQRSPHGAPRARSSVVRLPASTKFTSRQLPVSHLALPTLRSQRAHRAQHHRATTGISMRASRHFLSRASSNGSRRCDRTSPPPCVFNANLRTYDLFLPARSSRNHSFLRGLSPLPPYEASVLRPLCPIHASQFAYLAP